MAFKDILEPFKHKHNILQYVVKDIVKKDLVKNFEYYAVSDTTAVRLVYPCADCKKDIHFIYDYDKSLIKFEDETNNLIGIEFTLDRILCNIEIKMDPQYHVMFNERNFDSWVEYKTHILEDINLLFGSLNNSVIMNHFDIIEEFDVSKKMMTGATIMNSCQISLDFQSTKKMYLALNYNYPKRFNITITNI